MRLGDAPGRRHHGRARAASRRSSCCGAAGARGELRRDRRRRRPQRPGQRRLPRQAGLRTLVLERRDRIGGILRRVGATVGRLAARPSSSRPGPGGHGYTPITPAVRAFAPQPDGRSVTLWADAARTAEGLRALSAKDADAYGEFDAHSVRRQLPRLPAGGDAAEPEGAVAQGRPGGAGARARAAAAWGAAAAARPSACCRWRSPTWSARCSSPTRSAAPWPRAACSTRRPARGPAGPRRSSWPTRPATTAARPGRRRSPAAGPGRSPRRWPRRPRPAARSAPRRT